MPGHQLNNLPLPPLESTGRQDGTGKGRGEGERGRGEGESGHTGPRGCFAYKTEPWCFCGKSAGWLEPGPRESLQGQSPRSSWPGWPWPVGRRIPLARTKISWMHWGSQQENRTGIGFSLAPMAASSAVGRQSALADHPVYIRQPANPVRVGSTRWNRIPVHQFPTHKIIHPTTK